jgi:hypothetical protein
MSLVVKDLLMLILNGFMISLIYSIDATSWVKVKLSSFLNNSLMKIMLFNNSIGLQLYREGKLYSSR